MNALPFDDRFTPQLPDEYCAHNVMENPIILSSRNEWHRSQPVEDLMCILLSMDKHENVSVEMSGHGTLHCLSASRMVRRPFEDAINGSISYTWQCMRRGWFICSKCGNEEWKSLRLA